MMIRCENCGKLTFEDSIEYLFDAETGTHLTKCPRCFAIESFEELYDEDVVDYIEDLEFNIASLNLKINRLKKQLEEYKNEH